MMKSLIFVALINCRSTAAQAGTMEFVIPYDTAGYGTHNYSGTMRMQSGDTAVFPVTVPGVPGAPHGRIVQLTNEMTYTWTAGTGAVWWEDMAMGVSDNNTGCQISWGGYTASLRLPNYQGLSLIHISEPTRPY